MLALEARRMGYRARTFSPEADTPAGQVCDAEASGSYDDLEAVSAWARGVHVVTFEFENVPAATVEACALHAPVRPGGAVLHTTQNRAREKNWLRAHGIPTAPFALVPGGEQVLVRLREAVAQIGTPCVLKTAGFGYDGKGQSKINSPADIEAAAKNLGTADGVLEGWVRFDREVSVVAARGASGEFCHLGVVENQHENHILDVTIAPASVGPQVLADAVEMARVILEKLDVVGVLCVEFFLLGDGSLVVNELAPRPHNSGHWSLDACSISQFEMQLRAVCGLPLPPPRALAACAMANLLGDVWQNGVPNWAAALRDPNIRLHLYGKAQPRAGRKMGHLCALADTPAKAAEQVRAARAALLER
jgi:5-(carboxyamino)imidazole ribonucleotide synthase